MPLTSRFARRRAGFTAVALSAALFAASPLLPAACAQSNAPIDGAPISVDAEVTTPRAFLGFTPGDEYRLADYKQSWDYFHKIAEQTGRMLLMEIGKSSYGEQTMLAVISSEANLKQIDRWKTIARTLAEGKIPEAEARKLAAEGKAVVWIDGGMHATEIGSAQHTINLGYDLIAREDPEFRRIRDKVIVLLCPSINPDGQNIVARWFNTYYGTPQEGTPLPVLYQKYSGHDNNRDWYMLNLPETRNATQVLYFDWFPQVVYNHHQAPGMFPERMFVPPYDEPLNPNTPPLVTREINALGTAMHAQFSEEGKTGVVSLDTYSAWWDGGMRTTPWFHNVIGILTEVTHTSPYTAHYVVGKSEQEPTVFYPDPYAGGTWRFADTVAYMNTGSISLLRWTADHAGEVQLDRWRMAHDAVQAGQNEAPYGFVVPLDPASGQRDPNTAALFLERMRLGGLEVRFAQTPFVADGKTYPAGTAVLLASQANRPFLLDMCLPQHHPMRTLGPGGPPIRPYDIAGWTLTLQMGVAAVPMTAKPDAATLASLSAPTDTTIAAPLPSALPAVANGGVYLFMPERNVAFVVANRLLAGGIPVRRWTAAHTLGGTTWPAGTFVVPANDAARTSLTAAAADLRLPVGTAAADASSTSNDSVTLHAPRVATYDPYGGDIPQGWAQYVLDEFAFPNTTVTNPDFRTAGGLAARCDTLILTAFPNVRDRTVTGGARKLTVVGAAGGGAKETAGKGFDPTAGPDGGSDRTGGLGPGYLGGPAPKELAPEVEARLDGIGASGEANLKSFVENGGTLIASDGAVAPIVELFRLPVKDVTRGSKFYSPGSVFRAEVDTSNPLCWGLPPEINVFFDRGAAFALSSANGGSALVRYPDANPLESGWIIEDQVIRGQAAAIAYPVGKGRVIVYGFGITFRGQPHQGYPLLFNALYGMP